jgi:predicted HTH transcriptional regulator
MPRNPDSANMRGFDITRVLTKVYSDDEITVLIAPDDSNLENLILDIVRSNEGISVRELRRMFAGISSEDRIRRAIIRLIRRNKLYMDSESGALYAIEP